MVNSCVIILGAASTKEAKASPALLRRTQSGCDIFHKTGANHLVLCGGQTNSHHFVKEAEIMAEIARSQQVKEEAIIQEGQSRNTFENAIFSKRLLKEHQWDEITIVTDRVHLLRARMVFGALGIRARFHAAHCPPHSGLNQISTAFYEVPALLWYAIRIICGHHKPYLKKS